MSMGALKTSKLLSRIVNDRMNGLDIMCPAFCGALDRLNEGNHGGSLGDLVIRMGAVAGELVNAVLCHWTDDDCQTVFNYSRNDILDMIG